MEFSQAIECIGEKHRAFAEQVECREAEIFISIPCLLILKSIDSDQQAVMAQDRAICRRFLPTMFRENEDTCRKYNALKEEYQNLKTKHLQAHAKGVKAGGHHRSPSYEFYNEVEKTVLGLATDSSDKHQRLEQMVRQLGMEL